METLTEPPAGPPAPPPGTPAGRHDHRVLAGVAFDVAGLVGVDPLWVRLVFVALAPFGGLGVALYAAAWLVLRAGRRSGSPWFWFVAAGVVMWVWAGADVSIDSTLAWIVLLGGAALALWQPRTELVPASPEPGEHPTTAGATAAPASRGTSSWAPRPRRVVPREPSIVGRIALGVALLVAAAGALIDHLNGGRLHPEQWLGAAAVVCGIGLVATAWRGRAWWLIVPAAVFAGSGWLAGHAARAGVEVFDWNDDSIWIWSSTPAGSRVGQHAIAGDLDVHVNEAPTGGNEPAIVETRVGVGEIRIWLDDEVTVEVRPVAHDGAITVHDDAGVPRRIDGPITLGPEGQPDVIVLAEVSRGDVEIRRGDFVADEVFEGPGPDLPDLIDTPPLVGVDLSSVRELADGVRITSDGTVILPDSAAVLSPDGEVWLRDGNAGPPGMVTEVWSDEMGPFLLLPNQTIVSPTGTVIDIGAVRAQLPGGVGDDPAPDVTAPDETAPDASDVATSDPVTDPAVTTTGAS